MVDKAEVAFGQFLSMNTGAFVNGGEIIEHSEGPGGFVLEIMQNGMVLIA